MSLPTDPPPLGQLLEDLPAGLDGGSDSASAQAELARVLGEVSARAIPTGRLSRMWSLGTLQAKILAAYLTWWLRSGFQDAEKRQRGLDETHIVAALQVLGRMSYLRGAVMKLGQTIAHWPHVVPSSFADVLSRLYMDAPPMHYALLREHATRELGGAPEEVFEAFEEEAFAAASLGQVHRARLRGSGLPVAVKIQYPDIARTIREDMRNLKASGFPMRLSGDWKNLHAQYESIERMLEREVDYEEEARQQSRARETLAALEDIVVPRVHAEHSTRRVLTTELLEGVHLDRLRAGQKLRDAHGAQIARAIFRLWYSGRIVYADPHPGNFLFLADGRLGLLDFGCCHAFSDDEFRYVMEFERACLEDPAANAGLLVRAVAEGCDLDPEELSGPRLEKMIEYCDWLWEPLRTDGPFDFGAPGHFERGVRLYGEFVKRRWTRSKPVNVWLTKVFFGVRAMLAHLEARVDYRQIMLEESARIS